MGTRADFYIGKGKEAEWVGSIAWDGYPDGIDKDLLSSTTEEEYRDNLSKFFEGRRDVTRPDQGWPWPWVSSRNTDYSYWLFDGKVHASCFGHVLYDPFDKSMDWDPDTDEDPRFEGEEIECPTFSKDQMAEPGTSRSGIMVFGV